MSRIVLRKVHKRLEWSRAVETDINEVLCLFRLYNTLAIFSCCKAGRRSRVIGLIQFEAVSKVMLSYNRMFQTSVVVAMPVGFAAEAVTSVDVLGVCIGMLGIMIGSA